jgi:hypothetical protein
MPFGAASSNYRQGVELLKGDVGLPAYTLLPNSEYLSAYLGSESARDNLRVRTQSVAGSLRNLLSGAGGGTDVTPAIRPLNLSILLSGGKDTK